MNIRWKKYDFLKNLSNDEKTRIHRRAITLKPVFNKYEILSNAVLVLFVLGPIYIQKRLINCGWLYPIVIAVAAFGFLLSHLIRINWHLKPLIETEYLHTINADYQLSRSVKMNIDLQKQR